MKNNNYCFHNHDMVRYEDFRVHVSDLSLQRGYGVFDFFRIRNGEISWLDDYTDRLYNSVRLAGLEMKVRREDFIEMVHRLQEKNGMQQGAFKVIVSGGPSENLAAVLGPADLFILNVPWTRPPQATYDKGVQLLSYRFGRPEPEIKTLNYFNTLRLRKEMLAIGAIDIMFHREEVYEASRANIFAVKGGRVFTPGEGMLYGITRKQVLALFPEIRIAPVMFADLFDFDELFVSSTSRDITPIVGINDRKIGSGKPGPFTREVQEAFRREGWVYPV